MQCSICGGLVIWKGPLSNLTHTECQRCGAMNSQIADDLDEGSDDESEYCECDNDITLGEIEAKKRQQAKDAAWQEGRGWCV